MRSAIETARNSANQLHQSGIEDLKESVRMADDLHKDESDDGSNT
jgi:hypothetical protein